LPYGIRLGYNRRSGRKKKASMHPPVSGDEPPPCHAQTVRGQYKIYPTEPSLTAGRQFICAAALLFTFFGAVSLQAGVFTYVDKSGTPQLTDNFFELPQKERRHLLKTFEKKALEQYSATEINRMKATGNWPPLEIIRKGITTQPSQQQETTAYDYDAVTMAAKKIRTHVTRQRNQLNKDKRRVKEGLPKLIQKINTLEKQKFAAHTKDVINGSVGKSGFLAKLNKKINTLQTKKSALLELKNGGLRTNERRINRGEIVYRNETVSLKE
jgi:hypothetical protein